MRPWNWQPRILPATACFLTVIACLLYAAFRDQLPPWWRQHGGGVPYVMLWILLWCTLVPSCRYLLAICGGCVLVTCGLEWFQLYQGPAWLNDFRGTRFGAAWLGAGFDWRDMPPYVIGGAGGWIVGRLVLK